MKEFYLTQPFAIRSKNSKSMGMIIPSGIVKKYKIDESTGLILRYDERGIWLQCLNVKKIPADQSFEARDQQVSIVKGEN